MSQTHKNMICNVAAIAPVIKDNCMVISEFNKEIVQVECKVDEAQKKAEVQVAKLKANKAEWEQKHPQRQGDKCHKDKEKCCKDK